MFRFAFDAVLFTFQFRRPALTPLFQLPPAVLIPLIYQDFVLVCNYSGSWPPPVPRIMAYGIQRAREPMYRSAFDAV